jgi:hypothetical protein
MLAEASTTSRRAARVQTSTALLLIELFNGKPLASLIDFASALGLPLNEIAQREVKRIPANAAGSVQLGRAKCVRRKTMCANVGGGNPGD